MRIKLTLFFLILWTGVQMLSAQTLGNYTFSTGIDATKWIPLTTTTNLLTVGSGSTTHPYDSRRSTVLDIGFTFTFGSEQYTKFSVNSDGNLCFGTTATGFANYFPPPFSSNNSNANNPKINFFGANGDATFFQPNYVAMPPIDPNYINLQNSELSFYAKGNSTGAVLQVGVMSDPEDAATFELVSTLVLTDQYQLYEVPLADYLGSGTYVAIRNVNMDIIRLDNLTLGPLSACSKPTRLVAHPEIYEATLEWFSTATNFNLYYKTSSAPGYTVVQNVQNTYQLTNLTENTDYMWYVAARCGDTLKESAVSTFHTLCELIPHQDLPFVETFDSCATTADLNTCFTRLSLDQDYPRV